MVSAGREQRAVVAVGRGVGQGATPVGPAGRVPGAVSGWQRLGSWRTRSVVIIVGDPVAGRRALVERVLECPRPACGGRLRPWTAARARWVHGSGGTRARVRPDRGRCTGCGATQVLLPAACLPRRAYTADVIGAVLLDVERGRPVARAAAAQLVPISTARRWVTAVTRSATVLRAMAVRVASAFGRPEGCWPAFRSSRPDGPLTAVLCALGGAASAWTQAAAAPARSGRPGILSGIDYLTLLRQDYQRQLQRDLGVADPEGAFGVTVTGWPLVNAVTGGALLTTPAD
jgi:hypothetical protein